MAIHRDETSLTDADTLQNCLGNSASFKSKVKITGKTPAAGNTEDNFNLVISLSHCWFKWWGKNCNNWYKTLCSSSNFINSR